MVLIEETVDIHAPIDQVFAAITDPRRTTEWNTNVLEVSDISPGPLREGSTWRQTALIMSRPVDLTCRVLRFDPPHVGELDISGRFQARTRTECNSVGDVTHVTQGLEFEPPGGVLGRLAAGIATGKMRGELRDTMERQRQTLEREAARVDGSPSPE